MPSTLSSPTSAPQPRVVVLATGGTIAGTAARPEDALGYTAAQRSVTQLIDAVPALARWQIEAEQVAQIDSKDMDAEVWRRLVRSVATHLARADVAGIVITHGTDTLEETAYLLQRLLAPAKPVVLTAAMRPATALQADGPQNLLDAVAVACEPGASGVMAVVAGRVHSAFDVRKTHTFRLDAFGSGDAGPLGSIEDGRLRRWRDWPRGQALGAGLIERPWPRVELVMSHAGVTGAVVDALVAHGVDGLVAVGTGNATLHQALEAALRRAEAQGVVVRRATRVPEGPVLVALAQEGVAPWPSDSGLTAAQARIALALDLMQTSGAMQA